MNTLTLGIQTQGKFRITFDYYAHGQLYSDEFQSPVAIAQNETIPLTYNPLHPKENSRTSGPGSPSPRGALIGVGIAGSILLSLAWLLILRGCS
jgi:hypothetical protein